MHHFPFRYIKGGGGGVRPNVTFVTFFFFFFLWRRPLATNLFQIATLLLMLYHLPWQFSCTTSSPGFGYEMLSHIYLCRSPNRLQLYYISICGILYYIFSLIYYFVLFVNTFTGPSTYQISLNDRLSLNRNIKDIKIV